jgi:hypothetical protein
MSTVAIYKYVAIFWNEKDGWTTELYDNSDDLISAIGYGDFAGSAESLCIVPIQAYHDAMKKLSNDQPQI